MDELYAQSAFDDWWVRVGLPPQHFCYLLFDQYGHLLYVGITNNLRNRLSAHYAEKPWIGEVTKVVVERYNTREESKARETYLIKNSGPVYNLAENERLSNVVSYFSLKLSEECPGVVAAAVLLMEAVEHEYGKGGS